MKMQKKTNGGRNRVVYSTNPDFEEQLPGEETEKIAPGKQTLYVSLQRLKGNKMATIIENFQGEEQDLVALCKRIKVKCGTGGNVKDGIVLIQGEQREKVLLLLQEEGFKTKRKGG